MVLIFIMMIKSPSSQVKTDITTASTLPQGDLRLIPSRTNYQGRKIIEKKVHATLVFITAKMVRLS